MNETPREFLSTSEAAKKGNLSTNYISWLLRHGKLEGFRVARDWLVYEDSLEAFLATERQPGPKGPFSRKYP